MPVCSRGSGVERSAGETADRERHRDLRQLDSFAASNDPLLQERIQAALAGVEQVEMELRRKVEDTTGGGSVRSPGGEKVPQGYADKVAEYYRKLGKSK